MKILLQLIQNYFGLKLVSYIVEENGWNSDDENSDENNSWNSDDENNSDSDEKNSWEQTSYEKWKNMEQRKKQEKENQKNNSWDENQNQNNENQNQNNQNNEKNNDNSEKKFSADDVQNLIKQEFQNRDNINNQKKSFFNEVDQAANALSEYWLKNDKENFKNIAIDRDKNGLTPDDVFILANKDLIFEKLWNIPKSPMSSDSGGKNQQKGKEMSPLDFAKSLLGK